MQRRKTALSSGVLATLAVAIVVPSCREPTEMTVRITTSEKCADLSGVQVVVGRTSSETQDRFAKHFTTAVTSDCDATGLVGTLVVTPGGSGGTIVVSAGVRVGGNPAPDPTACADAENAKSCIIARRTFSFVEHTSLRLPIELDPLCVGKACDPASTCFKGSCVDASVTCNGDQCGLVQEHPGEGDSGATEGGSSDGAYDADLDAASFEDTSLPGDGGTIVKDAMPDAASGGFDAGSAICGTTGGSSAYCFADGTTGVSKAGSCDGTTATRNCCICKCAGSGKVIACDTFAASGAMSCSGSCQ